MSTPQPIDSPLTTLYIPDAWSVIPVNDLKKPALSSWKGFQTTRASKAQIEKWWADLRDGPSRWFTMRGLAVVTGALSGIIALDFDSEAAHLVSEWGLSPHVWTPSGGFHVYVKHPGWTVHTYQADEVEGNAPWSTRWPNIDIRADGGYAVFSATMDNGSYDRVPNPEPYTVEELRSGGLFPEDLLHLMGLLEPRHESLPEEQRRTWHHTVDPTNLAHVRGLDFLLAKALNMAWEGVGRSTACFGLMRDLRDHGVSENDARDIGRRFWKSLPICNTKGQEEPFSEREMLRTLRSAYEHDRTAPRLCGTYARVPCDNNKLVPLLVKGVHQGVQEKISVPLTETLIIYCSDGQIWPLEFLHVPDPDHLSDSGGEDRSGNGHSSPATATPSDLFQRNGAKEKEEAAKKKEQRVFPITFEELDARPTIPRLCLVDPFIAQGEEHLLFGPPRAFKSFVTMELGLSVVTGRPLFGVFPSTQGTVLYMDLENNPDRLRERINASLSRDGLSLSDLGGRLILQDRGPDIPRWRLEEEALLDLVRVINDICPVLVVVDNLRSAMPPGKNENNTAEINPLIQDVIRVCSYVRAAFWLVHHTNRTEEDYAGAGGIESTIGNVYRILRNRTSGVSTVSCDSTRAASEWDPFGVRMGTGGALELADAVSGDTFDRILSYLSAHGPDTVSAIATATALQRKQIDRAMETMRKDKRVVYLYEAPSTSKGGKPAGVFGLPEHAANTIKYDFKKT